MPLKQLPRRLRHGEEATLVEHLGELRTRLLIALVAVTIGFVVAFVFDDRLLKWLLEPLPDDRTITTLGVTEPFFTTVKVCFLAGIAAALPVVLYQLWAFLAPAMEEHAQRVVAVFSALGAVLFAAGVVFGYYVVLPKALTFLTSFNEDLFAVQIRASYYFGFVSVALFGMGLVFEMPIFILALVRLQVVSSAQLRRNWRMGIFVVVLVAILLPTVDPVSLAFEVIPLLALYFMSVGLATLMERRWQRTGAVWTATE